MAVGETSSESSVGPGTVGHGSPAGSPGAAPGEGFTPGQQTRIEAALSTAREETGVDFSLFVGDVAEETRVVAERLHAALDDRADEAVLLLVAPGQRRLEIVTGGRVRRRVPDRTSALAAMSMTTAFAGGDLVGGIVNGLRMLADGAGRDPGEERRSSMPAVG